MSRLYRGYNGKSPLANHGILWLTDSKSYAKNFGDKVAEFEIDDSKVDCPMPKELYKLAGCSPKSDTEGFYELMFSPTKEFIRKLKDQEYNSYAFDDDEYHAVILALFDTSIVKLVKSMSQKSVYFSKLKCFATYGGGPHHTVVAHKDGGGKWRAEVIDEDYRSVREAFKNTDPEKETYKVYRLD